MGEPKISQEARDAAARAVSWVTNSPPKPKPEFASMWEGDLAEVMQSLINSALELAAELAEEEFSDPRWDGPYQIAGRKIAATIRSLKDA